MAPRPHSILPPWLLGESTARISMEGSLSNLDLGQRISFEQQPSAWKLHKGWTVLIGCSFHAIILCHHLECAVLPDFCTAISWLLQDVSHFYVSHFSQTLSGLTIKSFYEPKIFGLPSSQVNTPGDEDTNRKSLVDVWCSVGNWALVDCWSFSSQTMSFCIQYEPVIQSGRLLF